MVVTLLLGGCSASGEDMSQSGDGQVCTPIEDILSFGDSARDTLDLTITNDKGHDIGVITWMSDTVTSMVRTASLKLYLKIALNVDFRFTVAILMTLSVILFTASVILGLTQANGYNALMFVLKLIIIYNLTINYYYFDVYVIESFEGLLSDAMMFTSFAFSDYAGVTVANICPQLVGAACDPVGMISSIFGLQSITTLSDLLFGTGITPDLNALSRITLFGAMDKQLSEFFRFGYWEAIMALAVTGTTGILWALTMLALIITYFIAVVMVVKTFLIATIARFVLYGLGPIFITFALFNQTRSLFDGWLQQLISFTLQPIFLFVFIGMFHTIFSGFTSKMYVDTNSGATEQYMTCYEGEADCVKITCTSDVLGCFGGEMWQKKVINKSSGACIQWYDLDSKSDLKWFRLCDGEGNCPEESGESPNIPIDLWNLISAIVICYLMIAMCRWVVDIANTLAQGAVTLTDVKVQGWDRLKGQVKGSINQGIGKAFRSGPK